MAARASTARPVAERFRWSETASGAPVDPHDLVIAALIGQVRRVIVDSVGRVIDLGRRSRLFTGAAREAVLLSGDRCCWPGCDQRTRSIQIDHLQPWATAGGATNPFNGGPECPCHVLGKHRGQVTVTRDDTGWHHYRPDGTEIATRLREPADEPGSDRIGGRIGDSVGVPARAQPSGYGCTVITEMLTGSERGSSLLSHAPGSTSGSAPMRTAIP